MMFNSLSDKFKYWKLLALIFFPNLNAVNEHVLLTEK